MANLDLNVISLSCFHNPKWSDYSRFGLWDKELTVYQESSVSRISKLIPGGRPDLALPHEQFLQNSQPREGQEGVMSMLID